MWLSRTICKANTTAVRNYQVTVLGAANEVGQSITLLLRNEPSITKLIIHDSAEHTPGVVMDVSHIPAESIVSGFSGDEGMEKALKNADIVLATGGVTARPGLTKKNWFSTNTAFIKSAAAKIGRTAPMPFVGIVTEPINSLLPMAAEIMRNHGHYDAKKLFGITTIDLMRAQCLYAAENNLPPCDCRVPVIGGHSHKTAIPLLSQAEPSVRMNETRAQEFTASVRKFDAAVTKAKKGFSPTLSVAYSVLVFVRNLISALNGETSKVNAYVENDDFGSTFFSGLVTVTKQGAGDMDRYTGLSNYECYLLERSIEQLRKDISKGKKILEWA